MFRWTYRLLGLSAMLLAGCALYLCLRPAPETLAFRVEEPERDLGSVALGTTGLTFPSTNQSRASRRILGTDCGT